MYFEKQSFLKQQLHRLVIKQRKKRPLGMYKFNVYM
jgi:hypothetical protein